MTNTDFGFRIKQLSERLLLIEDRFKEIDSKKNELEDWDNARLLREWGISKRTAANYRKAGLCFYKRGGRLFYTPESRAKFSQQRKEVQNGNN